MVSFKSRVIAICAAGTLAIGSAAVAAPISFAQDGDAAVTEGGATAGAVDRPYGAPAPAGADLAAPELDETDLVDAAETGTLTIKKILGDPQLQDGQTHSGAPTGDANWLEGAQFKIERLTLDLTQQEGWRKLNSLVKNPGEVAGEERHNDQPYPAPVTTNAQGEAIFSELPVGVYYVTELPRDGYSASAPFLVSLPYSDGNTGKWEYTRTVYPKNQELRPNKQVDAQGATLGSNMKYTINTPIPAGDLSKLKITDQLKPQLSLVTGNGDGGPAPKVSFSAGNGTPTEMATDDYTLRTENNTLVVEFTEQGLSKLAEQRNGQPNLQVHVEFYAKVVSLPGPGESITNTAEVEYPNDVTITTDSGDTPENKRPTQTEYANLTITKYTDDQEGDVDLSGAEFNLYRCEAGELLGDPIPVAMTPEIDPNFSHADNAATLTTVKSDENSREGIFRGYGVPVRTFAAGSTAAQQYNYCVIETKAPTGFVRNPEIHEVELTGADDEAKLLSVRVENQRDNFLSSLPATGAWGIILVFLVGLGLLARGFYTSRKDGHATA